MKSRFSSEHFSSEDDEPLGPLANLVDIILVFACGLIAALVAISPNLQEHFNVDDSPNITEGKELASVPKDIKNSLDSKSGFKSLGQVYKDPKTGKLILISE
ncbi:DUF2149 domain-containing protein [Poseidonibacter ostreae]|jgi:hypothetical protein|uniref:DUF2149 domain-containing protein n=1 Tax=Poseidonibacter ostreae TaxID=2654171 RepID=A0A6L4WPN4_9BACT|nr:DUF2149 domain-containing protein [Poseidonibacter ostreae]KAB7885868.1 DUF2149 domain-containing protein [Poseidonibacter ostreae]KAB7888433.1 DUF2149 domain-containing protein [Poseidonibacter ostreae]MAC83019.1 hypothetical protein [Arcobacter sp.]|tara:strand:+ start:1052 stop:1357 length:306 start_codon:yes stop_codon:yes gene_type:complete